MIDYRNYWLTPQKLSSWIEIINIPEHVRRHIRQIGMNFLSVVRMERKSVFETK
jgi:hypothetical protein